MSSLKSFIKTGRLNSNARSNDPDATLSTISSVPSEDDDGYETPIDEFPQEKSKIAGELGATAPTAPTPPPGSSVTSSDDESTRYDRPIARRFLNSFPSLLSSRSSKSSGRNSSSTVRSSAASRNSAASRSSVASNMNHMPTIAEVTPPVPNIPENHLSGPPSTPPGQTSSDSPEISPASNFQPIRSPSGHASITSTIVGGTPTRTGTSHSNSSGPAKSSATTDGPIPVPAPTFPPASAQGSEKGRSGRSSGHSYSSKSKESSRFSWPMTPAEKAHSVFTRWFVDWWMFEIVCWLVSAICMSIVFIVVAHFNGKPLTHWRNGITLNAFIAVFSGFGRAALLVPTAEALGQLKWNWFSQKSRNMLDFEMLDGASRGPWGSFMLLARTKGLTLHSIGAAIILLTLPLDLFFQQIVSYPIVWTLNPLNSTVGRSVFYNPVPAVAWINGSLGYSTDFNWFGFSSSYFLESPIPLEMQPDCPTSNCTWSTFDTLAVCGSCTRAQNLAQFGCQEATGEWLAEATLFTEPANYSTCGWFLNRGNDTPVLLTGYTLNGTQPDVVLATRLYNLMDIIYGPYLVPGGTFNYKDIQNPIMDFIVSASPNGAPGALRNETPIVSECVLSYCVKTLQGGYSNGKYVEKTLAEKQLNTNDANEPWPNPNTYLPQYNLTLPDPLSANGSSTYGMTNLTARLAQAALQQFIPSTWTLSVLDVDPTDPYPNSLRVKYSQLVQTPWSAVGSANPWGGAGSSNNSATALINSLALTLSNVMRTSKDATTNLGTYVTGQTWESVVHVHLRLAYVSLPVILLLFSLIFLATTVVASSRSSSAVGVWKTSALAVLFNGLSHEIVDSLGSKVTTGDARRRSRNMNVHLEDED